jgi:ABC-type lipoprotein release transport system permease subunit
LASPPWPDHPLAVVSAELAAHLARLAEGTYEFDPIRSAFIPRAAERRFSKALVYADDVYLVPPLMDELKARGYQVHSDNLRHIAEIKKYHQMLDLMAAVVFSSVAVAGMLATLVVFIDYTFRRRGAIGIMRILGMPKPGVFTIFVFRSAMVGVSGALTALALGWVIGLAIGHVFKIGLTFNWLDSLAVLGAAVLTTLAGAGYPSWRNAYRLDPVEAISGARVG